MDEEQKPVETPAVSDDAEPSFEDIQKQNTEYEAKKEGLTNNENGSNIEPEKKPPDEIEPKPAVNIPEEWYNDGVPRSLKTMDDYHKWMVNQNTLRGKHSAEVDSTRRENEEIRRELAELRGAMGERNAQSKEPVDIESEWQPHLAEKPVQTIAEITKRVVDAVLKNELGTLRKDYDGKLSKYDGFLQEQNNRNARSSFLEKSKLTAEDEAIFASIIEKRSDYYKKQYSDEKGNLDTNGILEDAYERFKAMKYDEMQNGMKQENQKKEQNKTRAVVAPGTGKPPPSKEIEDFDKMSMEDQEEFIKSKVLRF